MQYLNVGVVYFSRAHVSKDGVTIIQSNCYTEYFERSQKSCSMLVVSIRKLS